eukprot:CAMPEP_0183746502 /NCGR_PEP_ID=MMETSP0737-20130205/66789_1 /TAXON_ID=385413 /ORGANISM="Thalassiosira miniscula, Strain CCMP1093" /LENGTH=684 /DNA_ID=CAMNT_0025982199 /DNA_START=158 /DNA_END=2211 /DNA_ORIENTATION=+
MKKFLPGRKSNSNGSSEPENDDVTERRGATFSSATPPPKQRTSSSVLNMTDPLKRRYRDQKVVGLADGLRASLNPVPVDQLTVSKKVRYDKYNGDIPLEDDEKYARSKVERRPLVLVVIGYFTALKIFLYYLISLSSLITIGLSIGMTIFWYDRFQKDPNQMTGAGMDWVLLGFAVITPLSLSIGIAFRRRERALIEISKFRSFAYQLFLSHCIWDWGLPPDGGRAASKDIDWVDHADEVLKELIAIGDELCRFLTLPTASMGRHRVTKSGRREAARTAEVAYRLYESLYTKRFISLSKLSERLKLAGLGGSEASRIRQFERFMGDAIENLRMVKTYRTPQTLRSFARGVDHADEVLKELIAIGDELCRFLTLPTTSRSRHRMTKSGRREAARTAEVAYRLYESLYTKRFVQLSQLSERIKLAGLGASEVSRMRQYERFMGDAIENLRMVKTYRTPQTLRSFARLFTTLLPPFFAPTYAQLSLNLNSLAIGVIFAVIRFMGDAIENLRMVKTYRTPQTLRSFARLFTTLLPPFFAPTYAQLSLNLNSLAIGVIFAVITALCLNALLEGVEILEDPFVAFVTLDGIDIREEFQVLHWQQLVSARNNIFPKAPPYGGQARFSYQKVTNGDIESQLPETPLGNASECSRTSHRKRRPNLGMRDASLWSTVAENETEHQRESGYQLCG